MDEAETVEPAEDPAETEDLPEVETPRWPDEETIESIENSDLPQDPEVEASPVEWQEPRGSEPGIEGAEGEELASESEEPEWEAVEEEPVVASKATDQTDAGDDISPDTDDTPAPHLDADTRQRLTEAGSKLREQMPPERWKEGDLGEREKMLGDIQSAACEGLDMKQTKLSIDSELPQGEYGWSDTASGEVGVGEWALGDDNPTEIVKTIAHEYRHNWQQAVIRGEIDHPFGDEARQELIEADRNYAIDALDYFTYSENALERDAEAVAKVFARAYHRKRAK